MASYSINQSTGAMSPVGLFAAGGSFPRQFSLNKNGTLAAVGLQRSSRVVILPFDATTGKFGQQVAQLSVSGGLSCTIWNE
jgi:6-phosphogluconolactonase (cycloisomerase 2 family)